MGGHAVASRGSFYARGDLVWRWKDWIDRRFMLKFDRLAPMPAQGAVAAASTIKLDQEEAALNQEAARQYWARLSEDGLIDADLPPELPVYRFFRQPST